MQIRGFKNVSVFPAYASGNRLEYTVSRSNDVIEQLICDVIDSPTTCERRLIDSVCLASPKPIEFVSERSGEFRVVPDGPHSASELANDIELSAPRSAPWIMAALLDQAANAPANRRKQRASTEIHWCGYARASQHRRSTLQHMW